MFFDCETGPDAVLVTWGCFSAESLSSSFLFDLELDRVCCSIRCVMSSLTLSWSQLSHYVVSVVATETGNENSCAAGLALSFLLEMENHCAVQRV